VMIAENQRFPELGRDLYERAKQPYLQRIERYLRERTQAGDLRVADPAGATRQLLGMINDQVFWPAMLVSDWGVPPAAAKRVVREAVKTFLARYAPDSSPPARRAR
jgi:hypothetical protein